MDQIEIKMARNEASLRVDAPDFDDEIRIDFVDIDFDIQVWATREEAAQIIIALTSALAAPRSAR